MQPGKSPIAGNNCLANRLRNNWVQRLYNGANPQPNRYCLPVTWE